MADEIATVTRVIFATTNDAVVHLDCVSDGMPFGVAVQLPYTLPWAALATEATLQRWADQGEVVDIRTIRGRDGLNLRITDGVTLLQLTISGPVPATARHHGSRR